MEAIWVAKRIALWQLLREPVQRSDTELGRCVDMSRSWVQKWRRRLEGTDGEDMTAVAVQQTLDR